MKKNKEQKRERRRAHIRKTVSGTSTKPRVFVNKSNRYFIAGVADDEAGKVLMSERVHKKEENVKKMAKSISTKLKKAKIDIGVFDRSGYKYHGLIKSFVEELRSNGFKI
jgi:large subunit ribosomal protein L18